MIDFKVYCAVVDWLKYERGVTSIYKVIDIGFEGVRIDVAGGKILKKRFSSYQFDEIIMYLVKIYGEEVSIKNMIGELEVIRNFMYKHNHLYIVDYGMQLTGPDQLYIYTCIPEKIGDKVSESMGKAGFGILVYRSLNQKVIVNIIKESVNHSTIIEHRIGTSSKVKTNLRLFDNICKTHPIYRKLFPNGRKHISIENS